MNKTSTAKAKPAAKKASVSTLKVGAHTREEVTRIMKSDAAKKKMIAGGGKKEALKKGQFKKGGK